MNKFRVEALTESQETLLMPLWARAVESRRSEPILHDSRAAQIVDSLDYDFGKFARRDFNQAGFCIRAAIVDQLVRQFLQQHPSGTIVEIGTGLDTRFERLDNGTARWFELDLPDVIAVRRQFFDQSDRRTFLATSVTDADWLETVAGECRTPLLFVAEGVFYFLSESALISLFKRLADRFPGSSIVFDSQSPVFLRYSNRHHALTGSRMIWSLRKVQDIESWDRRFSVAESIGFGDSPFYDRLMKRMPLAQRLGRLVFPPSRNFFRINRIALG
jgi:O-methyltransferase involved in polyketide biosynthesis